jgi:peptidylprolyl isomerase
MHPPPKAEVTMNQASSGDTVRVHYTGTLDDGTEFDSSRGREPLEFTIGGGQVISGFDQAVDGMSIGDSQSIRIPAEEAYGPRHEQLVQEVPNSALPEDLTPELGMQLQARGQDGNAMALTVTAVGEESITVDGNHSLAGEALTFELELVEIV